MPLDKLEGAVAAVKTRLERKPAVAASQPPVLEPTTLPSIQTLAVILSTVAEAIDQFAFAEDCDSTISCTVMTENLATRVLILNSDLCDLVWRSYCHQDFLPLILHGKSYPVYSKFCGMLTFMQES